MLKYNKNFRWLMDSRIAKFFENEGIEYYAALDYKVCRETSAEIIKRENFSPKSVIVFLLPYYSGESVNLSNYASSLDYHLIIRDITSRLSLLVSEIFPNSSSRGYGDHSPIDERSAALVCGMGILGDNGLLINEKYGSYIFIADLITDVEPEEIGASLPLPVEFCEHCGVCRTSCPTGILRGVGEDCLSAITQRKGALSESEVALMKVYNTVWGCDECQKHCPHNASPIITPIKFFHEDRISLLTSQKLSEMSKADFSRRAFAWRGRKTVERNLEKLGL